MSASGPEIDSDLRRGATLALLAAALFGASTPCAKLLLASVHPWLLAGLLYLGSGAGLFLLRLARYGRAAAGEKPLQGAEWSWLGAAILAGGVIAPVLLTYGLVHASATSASLLLNLEGVLTAVVAWFVFRENFDRRIALGMLCIVAGAAVLAWPDELTSSGLGGSLAIAGACLGWALDNNLTRKVSLSDPVQIAMLKGLAAGGVNLLLALMQGAELPASGDVLAAGVVGFLGYGISLVLFVMALRHVGAARTGAYFSTAPFVGAALGVLLLHEAIGAQLLGAGLLMGFGVWLHLTERHAHEHEHEPLRHAHRHRHDAHHQHAHGPHDPPGEPHSHAHVHAPLRHSHRHQPDAHHRHRH
jgi:drug/metabolite transporter (DMT)-like permease